MEEIFERFIHNGFSELKGATAQASIPVSQSLLNEILQAALQGNKDIESCQVSIHTQNRASANLKMRYLPWALPLKMRLDSSVDFSSFGSPKIRSWLENNRFLGSLGSFFNLLPNGIKLYGSQVVLDIGIFLQTPELKRLPGLVKSVDIHTQEGKATFDVRIEVS